MENEKKYYLGLDIGTNSVGWAVSDDYYNLIRKKRKHLWGARLFEEANGSDSRRANRNNRRRIARRRYRINILREIFQEEINKVDPNFYRRLDFSYAFKEDLPSDLNTNYLFEDEKLLEEYHKNYSTIYHLRKELIVNKDKKFDIRFIYLAISHMIKYRGNFLSDAGIDENVLKINLKEIFDSIDENIKEIARLNSDEDEDEEINNTKLFNYNEEGKTETLNEIFIKYEKKSEMLDKFYEFFDPSLKKDKLTNSILKLINGYSCTLKDIFSYRKEEWENNEELAKKKIDFSSNDIEDTLNELASILTSEEFSIIFEAKKLYDYKVLKQIMKDSDSINESMIGIYDKHKYQLKELKRLTKEYLGKEEYKKYFSSKVTKDYKNTYGAVVGRGIINNKFEKFKKKSGDSLKAFKGLLENLNKSIETSSNLNKEKDLKIVNSLLEDYNNQKLFITQNNKSNGVIPYQLNALELKKIIENQGKYYPFLLEKGKDYPNPNKEEYKLISLLKFKIPYYIGPISNRTLSNDSNVNHWAKFVNKKEKHSKVYPWNFFDIVDDKKSGEAFIESLKNNCTYILDEPTMPKYSLIFQVYKVLSKLNNVLINGEKIDKDLKEKIIVNLYLKKKSVTYKDLRKYLIKEKNIANEDDLEISLKNTKDEEKISNYFDKATTLSSFIDFIDIFSDEKFYLDKEKFKKAEDAIKIVTIFEDKKTRLNSLKELFGNNIDENLENKLKKLNYKDWSSLSNKFLNGIKSNYVNYETGEVIQHTILDIMKEEPLSLNEIYETKKENGTYLYSFKETVNKLNEDYLKNNLDIDPIDNMWGSQSMKRATRQTIRITDELLKILNRGHFDKIFIETTREKGESKQTVAKDKRINDYLEAASKLNFDISELKEELKDQKANISKKKIYLYFTQLGRDLYTGEKIDINDLDKYDVDHIIPQAKLKDDSFTNLVLTLKSINNKKQDTYPLTNIINDKGREWIKKLHSIKDKNNAPFFMSKDKYDRLMRNNPLTLEEEAGFINRQLVMTNQSCKAVCDILKQRYKESEIVYSKAGNVSDFRNYFNLVKCRNINDFHHANDAYLNIVVGDIYNQKFTNLATKAIIEKYVENKESLKYDAKNIFTKDIKARSGDRLIWEKPTNLDKKDNGALLTGGTIDKVRKTLSYNDPMVTKMLMTQSGAQGFFNKISLVSTKFSEKAAMPLKLKEDSILSNTKYGGYNDLIASYFLLIECEDKKGNTINQFVPVLDIYRRHFKTDEEYLVNQGYKNAKLLVSSKLLINTVLEIKFGNSNVYTRFLVAGRTGENIILRLINEPHYNLKAASYIKDIITFLGLNLDKTKKPNLDIYKDLGPNEEIKVGGKDKEKIFNLTKNLELYDYMVSKYNCNLYNCLPTWATSMEKFKDNDVRNNFLSLNVLEQLKFLILMINFISANQPGFKFEVNQEKLDKKKSISNSIGTMHINSKLDAEKNHYRIVRESITGFYRKILFEK